MLNKMIRWLLRNRAIIIGLAIVIMAVGFKTGSELPVEVLPDLTKPTVTILIEAPGLAPEEVETLVTQPIESAMMGVAGLTRLAPVSSRGRDGWRRRRRVGRGGCYGQRKC